MVAGVAGNSASETVRRPIFSIDLGGDPDAWVQALVSIDLAVGIAPSVNVATLYLAHGASAPDVEVGDNGLIELGYEDSGAGPVFSGGVEQINNGIHDFAGVTATDGGAALARLRVNQGYEQQNAGDIVNDLTGQAGVDTDTVETGVAFPYYVVDDRRNTYEHIAELARKSGYIAYFTPEGALYFGPQPGGQPAQSFAYGVDILSLYLQQAPVFPGPATVIGAGAAGSQGQEAWSWFVKDPSALTAEAGNGTNPRLLSDPSLRSGEAAQAAADGLASAYARTALRGRIHVPGAPDVTVGSSIEIADAPQDVLNGSFPVCGVRHGYSKRHGFTSIIDFTAAQGGGAPGGL